MAIQVALHHTTTYRFDRQVTLSPHVVRLRPAPHCRTPILSYSLKIRPTTHFINWQQDPFGNFLGRIVFNEKASELAIEVGVVADMTVINPFDFFLEESAEQYPFCYEEQLVNELTPYLQVLERGPRLLEWVDTVDRRPRRTVDFLVELNQRLQQHVAYTVRMEAGVQTCEQTLSKAIGSCRDTGWLLVQILRHLGLAARFVSGYLVQLAPDVKSLDGPSGPLKDFTDLHAWAEVYVPGAGWIGLDATSGLFAGEGHIPLACTPEPYGAAPITGMTEPAEVEFSFANEVSRIHEDPRVTKPFTDEEWAAVDALGAAVDADLELYDVRLTMGGEPTFVSVDDMEGEEWNIAALGPTKRRLAGTLLRRLHACFAPGGVLQHAQGKWYPGEPLPRWALSCYWRSDGQPVWKNPALLAEELPGAYTVEHAQRFITELARRLEVAVESVIPGYEDALYYVWKEGTLPANVDPLRANVDDPGERIRLAELLTRGLGTVTGFALPIRWGHPDGSGEGWTSAAWTFRRGRMYLVPGDSPMGYRLPLDSLPWVAEADRERFEEHSLFAPRAPLGDFQDRVAQRMREAEPSDYVGGRERDRLQHQGERMVGNGKTGVDGTGSDDPSRQNGAPEAAALSTAIRYGDATVRSALCVEPRNQSLYVFLPPCTHLEHFLDLVAAIEATAATLRMPIVLEGYEPPRDWRLRRLQVTPDPGVIEVNLQPAHGWDELKTNTETLYEQARQTRLATEKFMVDGRHTGSGGGNHVTLGGETPADSPVLRRPDMLRSLLTYWQNHPGLSYLFSGLFIGPTSQAPRIDEARDDALYELGIAFQQVPEGEVPQPWLVDRLFRNLLIDVTGNTHRAEFCIDKLYAPSTATGRLGLVEMRAFEMPPHWQMSLVQQLLLRGLIAWFWREPYRRPLTRWHTALHDRFMLPHYVWADFGEVICDLERAGYPFQRSWFASAFEFRFPRYGVVSVGDITLEVRLAIEPWNVLGEEVTSQGTARYVDSSVERVQVAVTGLTGDRYIVACNGRRVPLRPTGVPGEAVAGVRHRAWQPPSALHPTIPAHTPLIFDVVDTWNHRSLGGCTYHVAHAGGRSYDNFPLNAYEAEARRSARFWAYGHTAGPMAPPPEERNPAFPFTLDLRYRDEC